jgi:hypothetical protein
MVSRTSVISIVALLLAIVVSLADARRTPDVLSYPSASSFVKVGLNGLDGDRGNSYPWTLRWFKGSLVACTLRHAMAHLPSQLMNSILGRPDLARAMLGLFSPREGNTANGTMLPIGSARWADELAARCYTYNDRTDAWTMVFKTPVTAYPKAQAAAMNLQNPLGLDPVYYPDCAGIRWGLVTKTADGEDDHMYVMGVGLWFIGLPWARVYRTADLATWEDWSTPSRPVINAATGLPLPYNLWDLRAVIQPRDIVQISGHVCVPGSIITGPFGAATSLTPSVHCRDPLAAGSVWHMRTPIALPGRPNPFPDRANAFQTSAIFNGKIFWGMQNNYGDGISIWVSDNGFDPVTGMLVFSQFMAGSFGDLTYSSPLITTTCGSKLMFSLNNGGGYYFDNHTAVLGTRGAALYAINPDLSHTHVIGDLFAAAKNSPTGATEYLGWPTSNTFAGINNPANHYFWVATTFKNLWFMGTFDSGAPGLYIAGVSGMMDPLINEALQPLLGSFTADTAALVEELLDINDMQAGNFAFPNWLSPLLGSDLWVTTTDSCSQFAPVTLNGFGNNFNYGVRTMLVAPYRNQDECLYVGFANPFTTENRGGAEIYRWCP